MSCVTHAMSRKNNNNIHLIGKCPASSTRATLNAASSFNPANRQAKKFIEDAHTVLVNKGLGHILLCLQLNLFATPRIHMEQLSRKKDFIAKKTFDVSDNSLLTHS